MKAINPWMGLVERTAGQILAFRLTFVFAMLVATLAALPVIAQQPSEDNRAEAQKSDVISGRVVNENGQPIANATVFVRTFDSRDQASITTTDSEGSFRVTGLQPMAYQVSASVPAYTTTPRDPG
ncbi:MAG: carboxypeptidase-like regulatory domain-containing protein, partial [Pyrinomonadaceae bacterium]